MKSQTLIFLVFLALLVCSHAIQIKEHSTEARRRKSSHRLRKALSKRRSSSKLFPELWNAINIIYNRNDFSFNLGSKLKIGDYDLPVQVTLFYNQAAASPGWELDFKPNSRDAITSAIPVSMRAAANVTDETVVIVTEFAWIMGRAYTEDLISKATKALFVGFFPPMAPLFVVWSLLSETKHRFQRKNEHIYTIGYGYKVTGANNLDIETYVTVTINLYKLQFGLNSYAKEIGPSVVKGFVCLDLDIKKGVDSATLKEKLERDIADFGQTVKNFRKDFDEIVGTNAYYYAHILTDYTIIYKIQQMKAGLSNAVNETGKLWSSIKSHPAITDNAIIEALKIAVRKVERWLKKADISNLTAFSRLARGKISYSEAFRIMNRRFLRNARRGHSKY